MVLKVPSSFHFKDTTYHPESRCDSIPQAAISAPALPPRKEIWNREDFSRQIAIDSLHSYQFSSVADHAGAQKRSLSPTRNAVFRFIISGPLPGWQGTLIPKSSRYLKHSKLSWATSHQNHSRRTKNRSRRKRMPPTKRRPAKSRTNRPAPQE